MIGFHGGAVPGFPLPDPSARPSGADAARRADAEWLRAAADRVERGEATIRDVFAGMWSDGPGAPRGAEYVLTIRERPDVATFGVDAPALTFRELALTEGLVQRPAPAGRVRLERTPNAAPASCPDHGAAGPLVAVEWQDDLPDGWRSVAYHCGCGFVWHEHTGANFYPAGSRSPESPDAG